MEHRFHSILRINELINYVDYEQSLLPLGDSRGEQASERYPRQWKTS